MQRAPSCDGPADAGRGRCPDPSFHAVAGIPDRGQPSLMRCLAAFTKPELLTGDSAYHCDVCAAKRTAMKRVRLHSLPPALVVHINRAVWLPRNGGRREKLQACGGLPLALP